MARGLKFRIYEVEGLYYLCSENKGADQPRGYREADLRLCFRICKKPFSHDEAQMVSSMWFMTKNNAQIGSITVAEWPLFGGSLCIVTCMNDCSFFHFFHFGFEASILVLIVPVPARCFFLFTFCLIVKCKGQVMTRILYKRSGYFGSLWIAFK